MERMVQESLGYSPHYWTLVKEPISAGAAQGLDFLTQ